MLKVEELNIGEKDSTWEETLCLKTIKERIALCQNALLEYEKEDYPNIQTLRAEIQNNIELCQNIMKQFEALNISEEREIKVCHVFREDDYTRHEIHIIDDTLSKELNEHELEEANRLFSEISKQTFQMEMEQAAVENGHPVIDKLISTLENTKKKLDNTHEKLTDIASGAREKAENVKMIAADTKDSVLITASALSSSIYKNIEITATKAADKVKDARDNTSLGITHLKNHVLNYFKEWQVQSFKFKRQENGYLKDVSIDAEQWRIRRAQFSMNIKNTMAEVIQKIDKKLDSAIDKLCFGTRALAEQQSELTVYELGMMKKVQELEGEFQDAFRDLKNIQENISASEYFIYQEKFMDIGTELNETKAELAALRNQIIGIDLKIENKKGLIEKVKEGLHKLISGGLDGIDKSAAKSYDKMNESNHNIARMNQELADYKANHPTGNDVIQLD